MVEPQESDSFQCDYGKQKKEIMRREVILQYFRDAIKAARTAVPVIGSNVGLQSGAMGFWAETSWGNSSQCFRLSSERMRRLYEEWLPIPTIPNAYLPIPRFVGPAGAGVPTCSVEAKTRILLGAGKPSGAVADAQAAKTKLPIHAIPL